MDKTELIDKYIQGLGSEEEVKQVNELARFDTAFAEELEFRQNLMAVTADADREKFKEQLQDLEPDAVLSSRKYTSLIASVAAIALLLFSYIIFTNAESEPSELFADNFEPYRNVVQPVVRGQDSETTESKAFAAYEREDFKEAASLFESIPSDDKSDYIYLYMGNSYLAIDEPEKAISVLNSSPVDSLSGQFKWYLALAYLQAENAASAKTILEELAASQAFRHEAAAEILEKISD